MNMNLKNFPTKSKWLKHPVGWEDLGEYESDRKWVNGRIITRTEAHAYCNTTIHIGKEDGKLFYFCPRCLIIVDDK